ncbi:hypothetical protein BZM27_23800 [Paraburkholderia steynii]|uniref:Uncharacterized protein n=1 Tax=Paraburkholderia steynii TaxID=1245441 RepID=A0A4R0XG18_9BURK|nr:hypothetical protein BZM27_23800 [Paraburkholderia steynii]
MERSLRHSIDFDAEPDAKPVAAGFTALPLNSRRPIQAGDRDPVSAVVLAPVKLPARKRTQPSVAGRSIYTGEGERRRIS